MQVYIRNIKQAIVDNHDRFPLTRKVVEINHIRKMYKLGSLIDSEVEQCKKINGLLRFGHKWTYNYINSVVKFINNYKKLPTSEYIPYFGFVMRCYLDRTLSSKNRRVLKTIFKTINYIPTDDNYE